MDKRRNTTFISYVYNGNHGVDEFISKVSLDEGFDKENAKYVLEAKIDGETAGVVVYGDFLLNGKVFPRFLHIVIDQKYRRSRFGVLLMKASEHCFRQLGHKVILAHILNALPNRDIKIRYAVKFGYIKVFDTNVGEIYAKKLEG